MSIKMDRCRQSKGIISSNDQRSQRRMRNIKLKRRNGKRDGLIRFSMSLGAVQSSVVLFSLLSCNSSTLRGIWGSFRPSNKLL